MCDENKNGCGENRELLGMLYFFRLILTRIKLIVFVALLFAALGMWGGFNRTPRYMYTTTIEVGSFSRNGFDIKLLEKLNSVKFKITDDIVPTSLRRSGGSAYRVLVQGKKNTNIITLETKAEEDDANRVRSLHDLIAGHLVADHRERFSVIKETFELRAAEARAVLDDLRNSEIIELKKSVVLGIIREEQLKLQADKAERMALISRQEALELIFEKTDNRKVNSIGAPNIIEDVNRRILTLGEVDRFPYSDGLSLYELNELKKIIDARLMQNSSLSELKLATIDRLKNELELSRVKRIRAIKSKELLLASAENMVDLFHDTKIVSVAVKSSTPYGIGPSVIVVMSLVFGFIFGILLAFGIDCRVRYQLTY